MHMICTKVFGRMKFLIIIYYRLGAVSIGAGCAKLSGHGNVWPTTGSDELHFAAWQPKMSTS